MKIFVSGYFSLESIVNALSLLGVECHFIHNLSGSMDNVAVNDYQILSEPSQEINNRVNKMDFSKAANYYGIGGVSFTRIPYFNQMCDFVIKEVLMRTYCAKIYSEYLFDRLGCRAVITHDDIGGIYHVICDEAKKRNIPVYCIYNGMRPLHNMLISLQPGYEFSDFYYLSGMYDVDYIKERNLDTKYMLSGNPGWDRYYNAERNIEEDTFLFSPPLTYRQYESTGPDILLSTTIYSMGRIIRNPDSTDMVAEAFAEFQKSYPQAKLIISLRPYFLFEKESYKRYIESFGVKNLSIYTHEEMPIRELYSKANYVITNVSTVLVESLINRIPTILISGNPMLFDNFRKRECYLEVSSSSAELLNALYLIKEVGTSERLIQACDMNASYFNYGDDGKATERVLEHLRRKLKL